jgi:MoaA/NifB/PqqE/SkfB family radical SAM enzyme
MPDERALEPANALKSLSHPCFNGCGGKNTRIHLPVAPRCNIQCNYCLRKNDCVNESRPGVSSAVLTPPEAADRIRAFKEKLGKIDVAGIAGPGDALADFENTRETFRLVKEAEPDITLCLSTNGLLLPEYAEELARLGVSHVTVTVNAPDADTGRLIYRFVELESVFHTGKEAAALLLERQIEGIRRIKELGIICKVNMVMLKGINDRCIPELVEMVKEAGADLCNIMQLIPVKGSRFEHLPMVSNEELTTLRKRCETLLPQMYHCRQCRADAAGTLDEDMAPCFGNAPEQQGAAKGSGRVLRFAVASKTNMVIDQHFGHADGFYIYEYRDGKVSYIEKREVPRYCLGEEGCRDRWENMKEIINILEGCSGVIAMRIGETPRAMLADRGIRIHITYNYVSNAVREAAALFV